MTPTESLLALWKRCPETKPGRWAYDFDDGATLAALINHDGTITVLTETEAHAIACDAIERYLRDRRDNLRLEVHFEGGEFAVSMFCAAAPDYKPAWHESKLSALLAAATAILDREETPPESKP